MLGFLYRTGDSECCVREYCHEGSLTKSTMKVVNGHMSSEVAIPDASMLYASCGLIKDISTTKWANLVQPYNSFISDDKLLEALS